MLKWCKRFLVFLFVAVSMLAGFWLYSENPDPVAVVLYGIELPASPLGMVLVFSFVTGLLLGLLCNVLVTASQGFRIARLKRKIRGDSAQR